MYLAFLSKIYFKYKYNKVCTYIGNKKLNLQKYAKQINCIKLLVLYETNFKLNKLNYILNSY